MPDLFLHKLKGQPTIYYYAVLGLGKFISHRNRLRLLHSALNQTGINFKFTEGFRPHIVLSSCPPAPVGVSSRNDYFIVHSKDKITESPIELMNQYLPEFIKIKKCEILKEEEIPLFINPNNLISKYRFIFFKKLDIIEYGIRKLLLARELTIIKNEREKKIKKSIEIVKKKKKGKFLVLDVEFDMKNGIYISPILFLKEVFRISDVLSIAKIERIGFKQKKVEKCLK